MEERLHGWITSRSLASLGFYKGIVLILIFITFVLIHNKNQNGSQCFRYVDEEFIPFRHVSNDPCTCHLCFILYDDVTIVYDDDI